MHELEPEKKHLFGFNRCLADIGRASNKEEADVKFNCRLKSQKPLDIIVYIDKSQKVAQNNIPTSTGAEYVLNCVGSWHSKQKISLGKINKVYNAEAIARLESLKQGLKSLIARVAPEIQICLDNFRMA